MSGALSALRSVNSDLRALSSGVGAVVDAGLAVRNLFTVGDGVGALDLPVGFYELLQPASWRGLSFAVLASRVRAGRRKALHEYPFRDGVWVEDLGLRGRVYGFEAFLIGDDVGNQIKLMIGAAEKAGPGLLVHPTFGAIQVELIDFEAGEEWDAGRVWRFRAEFLEPVARGLQLQPLAAFDTANGVLAAAADAQGAASGSFLDQVRNGIGAGVRGVQQAVAAVTPYVATATRLVADAGRLAGAVRTISGNFGRYASAPGARGPVLRTAREVLGAVQTGLATAALARNTVVRTGAALSALVGL